MPGQTTSRYVHTDPTTHLRRTSCMFSQCPVPWIRSMSTWLLLGGVFDGGGLPSTSRLSAERRAVMTDNDRYPPSRRQGFLPGAPGRLSQQAVRALPCACALVHGVPHCNPKLGVCTRKIDETACRVPPSPPPSPRRIVSRCSVLTCIQIQQSPPLERACAGRLPSGFVQCATANRTGS